MTEYENEPVRGLPGRLPPGERILWQGAPDRAALARAAFHVRGVALYFALLAALALALTLRHGGSFTGAIATAICGAAAVAILELLAFAAARTTVYTLTNRRIVLRVGVAIPKCVNLPLSLVEAADLRLDADGSGDVSLRLSAPQQLGWLAMWPHARPWRLSRPEPTFRAIPDAAAVGALVARSCLAVQPDGRVAAPRHLVGPHSSRSDRGMSHSHETMLPSGAVPLAVGMVLLALIATTTARIAHLPPTASPVALRAAEDVAPVVSRDLRFSDEPDGSVLIQDAATGRTAGTVPAGSKTGFIRGVMRGLARDREKRGIGAAPPFRLTLWKDGELSLTDRVTGRAIELTAFGSTNRAAFAVLLPQSAAR